MTADIAALFEPRSVAVIGASAQQGKIGHTIVRNILEGGYKGALHPVNARGGEVLGLPAKRSLAEVEGPVDVACIAIPAPGVLGAVRECAAKGVPYAVVITSGFSETGNTAEERAIASLAREHGMRVLGPNVFGLYSSAASLNATFGPSGIQPGSIAFATQSGALGIAMIGKTKAEGIGLSAIVSLGNKCDIDEADLLGYFLASERSSVVLLYIEGLRGGERLVRSLDETTRRKPVVVIKSGRSRRGAMAAASHTGSLAGADEVFDCIMRQVGAIRAESVAQALDWSKFLASAPRPAGRNAVIITNGGGVGVLATDACERWGVELYDDLAALKGSFSSVMPAFGSAKNPIDLTGQASAEDYGKALSIALADGNIHSVICLGCESGSFDADRFAAVVEEQFRAYRDSKPIVFSVVGGEGLEQAVWAMRRRGVPIYGDVYQAVSCLGALYADRARRASPPMRAEAPPIDAAAVRAAVARARSDGRTFLLSDEGREVAAAAGLRMPRSAVARSLKEAVEHAERIGFPVVLKVVSKDIVHKTEMGAVALDLGDKGEVMDAYEAIMHNCRSRRPDAVISGVEVAEMVRPSTETIVGARRDPSFGPVVMFGLGGIYVEVMKDVSFRSFPLDRAEAMRMVRETRSYPLLLGVRGEGKKDIEAVVDAVLRVGATLASCEDITDIEVNPLVAYDAGEGVTAVDVRILLSKQEAAAAPQERATGRPEEAVT